MPEEPCGPAVILPSLGLLWLLIVKLAADFPPGLSVRWLEKLIDPALVVTTVSISFFISLLTPPVAMSRWLGLSITEPEHTLTVADSSKSKFWIDATIISSSFFVVKGNDL